MNGRPIVVRSQSGHVSIRDAVLTILLGRPVILSHRTFVHGYPIRVGVSERLRDRRQERGRRR